MLYPIQNETRSRLDLSGRWNFKSDPQDVGEQKGWFDGLENARSIAVPGRWNEQYQDRVWINGIKTAQHQGGHVPFEVDITDHLLCGQKNRGAICKVYSLATGSRR